MNLQIQFTSLKDVRRKQKKKWPKILLYSLLFIFILFNTAGLYFGNIFYNNIFQIETNKNSDLYDTNKNTFNEKRFTSLQREEVSVTSKNNYRLYGTYIKNSRPTKNTIILIHDLSGSRWSELKYLDMYLDKGFNVLIYDARNHGHSGGNNVTYGYYEKYDLDRWVTWAYGKNKDGIIGVQGEGLGAVTALLHSKLNEDKKRVSFYIADSSFSDLNEYFLEKLKKDYKVKNDIAAKILLFYVDKINKFKNHFSIKDVSPKKDSSNVSVPVMTINKESSEYVSDKNEYEQEIYKFIDSCLNKNN